MALVGIEISRDRTKRTLDLRQVGYIDKILKKFNLIDDEGKPKYGPDTPMIEGTKVSKDDCCKGDPDKKAEFDKLLSSTPQKRLVVVDFAASWCGPCQQIAPKFAAMAAALPHVCFVKVDVDECKDLQSQYGVTAMPTFKMLKGGKEVGSMQGADEGALREKIEALAGKPDRWAAAGSGRQL